MTATRRLAAIMAVDVVGYSRLMGEDEAGTALAVREHREAARPIVAGLGGRIVKTMGDGLLLEFPSVVAAVECAVAIQKLMIERNADTPEAKRIVYRIGVNLGDVLIEGDDILGDGVNIAARLEGIAAPGAICLSEDAYRHVKGRLDLAVSDLGLTQLKNIAEPIHVYSLDAGAAPQSNLASQSRSVRLPGKSPSTAALRSAIAAVLVVVALGAAGYAWRSGFVERMLGASFAGKAASAPHLSIVVLPFSNLSGDPNEDYFADGVTENLTSELSRIRNSFVIARNTAFTYKGKSVDAKEIGKDLGVRYILEGSVQRDQKRVRVNAQLIDAETGAHLWADRFEEDIVDLFKLQDEIVAELANTLQSALISAEQKKSAASQNPDLTDLIMKASASGFQPGHLQTSRELLQQVLNLDPDNSRALCLNGWTYYVEFLYSRKPNVDYETMITGQADKAIAADRDDVCGYDLKGQYLALSSRPAEAMRVADQGVAVDPNSAYNYVTRAIAEEYSAQFEQDKADIEQAMRLSPHDPLLPWWRNLAADAELGLGHVDAARDLSRKAVEGGYHVWYSYLNLAATSALAGDLDEAKAALAQARQLNPKLSIKFLTERKPILKPSFDALRKAGLPEE